MVIEACEFYKFCDLCMAVLDKHNGTWRTRQFMHDNLDLNEVDRKMIEARQFRNSGGSLWRDKDIDGDNKAEPIEKSDRERSKREDSSSEYGSNCKFGLITEREMRCSELYGNIERDK